MYRIVGTALALLAAILAILSSGRFAPVTAQLGGPAQTYHASSTTCTTIEKRLVDFNATRVGLRVFNLGTATMYVGGKDIAPARSWPVHAANQLQQAHAFVLQGQEASGELYCVADASVDVKVLQSLR